MFGLSNILANYTCDEIGFGIHEKRQAILEKAVNKKLRINQHS